jgi:glycine hydroxymethyltransferase
VTTTTHKTLRGPRGGLVLCDTDLAEFVDRGCPMVLGGPLPHVMAAKAVALAEASDVAFRTYARAVVDNARTLAESLVAGGVPVVTGGTDNHLVLIDVRPFGLNGRQAEAALREAGITLNRNVVPNETNGAWYTSGLRLGTAAVTTLGMGAAEMREIGDVLASVLRASSPGVIDSGPNRGKPSLVKFRTEDVVAASARSRVGDLLELHPLYPGIEL